MYVFFHLFTFNLPILLHLKWVSGKQYIVGSWFLSNLTICLLICMFRPFTFNVTSDMVGFRATVLFFILCFSSLFLLCFYVLSCHLLDYLKLQYTCLTFQSLLVFTLTLQIKYKALQLHRTLYPPIYVIVVTCITCTYIKNPSWQCYYFCFQQSCVF